jgi:hypothetical protein
MSRKIDANNRSYQSNRISYSVKFLSNILMLRWSGTLGTTRVCSISVWAKIQGTYMPGERVILMFLSCALDALASRLVLSTKDVTHKRIITFLGIKLCILVKTKARKKLPCPPPKISSSCAVDPQTGNWDRLD